MREADASGTEGSFCGCQVEEALAERFAGSIDVHVRDSVLMRWMNAAWSHASRHVSWGMVLSPVSSHQMWSVCQMCMRKGTADAQ
ncbi:hypothetical protein D8M34_06760 [Microbacterium sp. HSID17254]|nr:hypothetical protein D8M34_06760 [Microbacterium sp. HSID17254]